MIVLKKLIFIILFFMVGCSSTPTPTPKPSYRNHFYAGMSSNCANLHSIDDCTKSINSAINNKEYESISPEFTSASDSFYFGMNLDCIKYEKFSQSDCSNKINPLIKNKYFDQLKIVPIYPTPNN